MELRIDNKDLFTGKEHYLAFRAAWARNSRGPNAAQHLLYGLLRGRDVFRCFTPTSNYTKLSNGTAFTHGIYHAMEELQSRIRNAQKLPYAEEEVTVTKLSNLPFTGQRKRSKWEEKWLDDFLAPFEGTVDDRMLVKLGERIGTDPIPHLFSAYGVGRLIHMKHEYKPIPYSALWDMYTEATQ